LAEIAAESPDDRAKRTEAQMTDDERFSLLISMIGPLPMIDLPRDARIPGEVRNLSAGYTPGVPRLGVPALQSSDASMGIANPGFRPHDPGATAFPATLLVAASFNPELARAQGAAIGREARQRGFNVLLAGGANLARDPRNGRNFEYYGEDPWLCGVLAAEAVKGTQGEGVISTLKHFTLNCNETNRHWLDAVIDPAAHRESDLLAFQIAVERAAPGSIMSAYNKINGVYASGSHHLLNEILKQSWGFAGWVMSDWGAVPHWEFSLAGLDQESGVQIDVMLWGSEAFTEKLRAAYAEGKFSRERLGEMVRRILRSIYAVGVDRWGPAPEVDAAKHRELALEGARQGIVLLKNDGALPLATDRPLKVAVIGGFAQLGVATGTGSSAVQPVGGFADVVKIGGPGMMGGSRNLYLFPSSPLAELKKLLPQATIEFDAGYTPAEARLLAKRSDVAVVFGVRVEGEGYDSADLSLPWGQDAVIDAVASVNPNTIVVLETGNPVTMPWQGKVKAIVQAWYSGEAGGQAIAEILAGTVNPSGRLPVTFPESLDQTPRPELPGLGTPWGTPVTIRYDEGAEVGYRWHAKTNSKPLYAFGFGLTYTTFEYGDLVVEGGDTISASFTVQNTGQRAGADVPQLYLTAAPDGRRVRLLGFERVALEPGESRRVAISADARLLARFEAATGRWHVAPGTHRIAVGRNAEEMVLTGGVELASRRFGN
jgi:beta-glucosidase